MSLTRKLLAAGQLWLIACLVAVTFSVLLVAVLAVKAWRWMRS